MAITSTLRKGSYNWVLRLVDASSSDRVDFPLLENYAPASLDLAAEGIVHESHRYRALLATDAPLGSSEEESILWSVNGEEPIALCARMVANHVEEVHGSQLHLYQLHFERGDEWFPFSMTYGFASVSLHVGLAGEGLRFLSTKDIACACDKDDQEASVLGMVDALISGSDDEAVRWMFGEGQARESRYALVESGTVSDSSESLSSFLALCERAVRGYEANLNYFCTHAHCRTVKTDVMVSPLQMRRLGREELLWLASNPDVLHATDAKTPLRINGRYVVPARMRTERPRKTFDTKENRALFSYAEEIAAALGLIIEGAQDDIVHIEAMISRLEGLNDGEGLIPALLMLRSCFEREHPLLRKAIALRKRMRSIAKALDRALPDVRSIRYRLPKRTKTFQEIPAYAEIHALMRA